MTDLFRRQQMAIRLLAQSRCDHDSWNEVCALLDELPDDTVRACLHELELELRGWPSEFRGAPRRWAMRLRTEGQEPRVQLCSTLSLSYTTSRDELWRALDSADAAGIDGLGVGYCNLDEAAMPRLARRLSQIGVQQLLLTSNRIGIGIGHILRLSVDGELVLLSADSCGLGQGVLERVVAEGAESGLRELWLGLNYFSPHDLEYLAQLPGLDKLRRLVLDDKFHAAGVRVLAEQAPLHGLQDLDLSGTQCGDEGAALLAMAPTFAGLEKLSLWSCVVTDLGATSLGSATSLTVLRELDLKFNRITAAGVRSLLASTHLPALSRMNLTDNEIGDDVVDVLAICPVARLTSLVLDDAHLSNEARTALQALPLPSGMLDLHRARED
jgi:hypothetical protein